jgi:WD40 repeat protein
MSHNFRARVGSFAAMRASAQRFDVFLSYNSRDREVVEQIAERLKRAGVEPWLDRWALTPGGDWQHELGARLDASVACAVFVGAHDLGAWELQEVAVAIDRAATQQGFRVFPVLLPDVAEPFDPNRLPHFLRARTWVDLRRGIRDTRGLQDLINAIKGVPFGSEVPVVAVSGVAPYRGLQVFGEEDARFFFGRDREVQRLLEKLKASTFLAVLGPSGSGKSSLVRAGLLPELRAGALAARWHMCVLRPGAAPLTALAAQLAKLAPEQPMGATLDALADDPRTLHLAVELALAERPAGERALVLIDQLEEVFTLCRDDAQRRQLFSALLYAASAPGARSTVIVTMRADFYARCSAYPEFAQLLTAQQMLVGPMDADALRQAIEEPAWRVGLELEAGLAETILADVAAEPGALPLLEHALLELWERRRGELLTLEGYRDTGGVEGALAQRADTIFGELSPTHQRVARRMLLRLTEPGEGMEDTRRRATRDELAPGDRDTGFDVVLGRLVDARLLTTGRDETGVEIVDVSHEALIRGWPRLRGWIEADRAGLLTHRRLTDAAREWDAVQREASALYRGARLAAAREWASDHDEDLSRLEHDFLAASQAAEHGELEAARRRSRRLRMLAIGLGALLALSAVATILAIVQTKETRKQERIATSRFLSIEAEARATSDPDLSILLSLAAFNSADTPEARRSLQSQVIHQRHVKRILTGRSGPVGALAYSPDGRLLVAAGAEGISVWDLHRSTPPATLRQLAGTVRAVGFGAGGRLLAAAGDKGVIVLDMTRPVHPRVRGTWRDKVATLAVDPRGRRVVFAGVGPTVIVQDVAGGRRETFRVPDKRVDGIAMTPDGRRAVTVGDSGASVWNLATRKQERRFRFRYPAGRSNKAALALSADGRRLVTDSGLQTDLWDVARGTHLGKAGLGSSVDAPFAFRPDGTSLAATSQRTESTEIDTQRLNATGFVKRGVTGDPESRLVGSRRDVSSLAYSADGRILASGSKDGTVTLWDPSSPETVSDARLRQIDTVAFDPDSGVLAMGGKSHKDDADALSFVDLARRRTVHHLPCGKVADPRSRSPLWAVSGACERTQFLAVANPARPRGRRFVTVLRPRKEYSRQFFGEGARFSHDGRLIAEHVVPLKNERPGDGKLSFYDKELLIWDPKAPQAPVAHIKVAPAEGLLVGAPANSYAFSPNGQILAIGRSYDRSASDLGDDVKVLLWDTRKRRTTASIRLDSYVHSVAFDPGGALLAVGLDDRVELWRMSDRRRVAVIRAIHGTAHQLAFTPDGKKLVVSDADGVQMWSVEHAAPSGPRLLSNQGKNGIFGFRFALSPDGRKLAIADGSDAVVVWNLDKTAWRRQLCQILDRDLTRSERTQFLPASQRSDRTCP